MPDVLDHQAHKGLAGLRCALELMEGEPGSHAMQGEAGEQGLSRGQADARGQSKSLVLVDVKLEEGRRRRRRHEKHSGVSICVCH